MQFSANRIDIRIKHTSAVQCQRTVQFSANVRRTGKTERTMQEKQIQTNSARNGQGTAIGNYNLHQRKVASKRVSIRQSTYT